MDPPGLVKKMITREIWEKRLRESKVKKEDMNRLVIDFLVAMNFTLAAAEFSRESGISLRGDAACIVALPNVLEKIKSGDFWEAYDKLEELDLIRFLHKDILFIFNQQKVVELVRGGEIEAADRFAMHLLPWIRTLKLSKRRIREAMENTIHLLMNPTNPPDRIQLNGTGCKLLAQVVHEQILACLNHDKDDNVARVMKMLGHLQDELDRNALYPHLKIIEQLRMLETEASHNDCLD